MATQYYSSSAASEKLEEIDEEEQLMWQSEHAAAHHHNHHQHHHIPEEEEEEDSEEDELMIEDASSMSSSPSIPDENINFDLVYALHTFVATVEGQASVVKGDALILMEDTNIYWWLVEVLKTREVGYIPAENIETPYERLARLNKHRNVEITSPSIHDTTPLPLVAQHPLNPTRRVTIGDESMSKIFHYEVESEIDEDGDQDRFEEEEEEEEEDQDQDEDQGGDIRAEQYGNKQSHDNVNGIHQQEYQNEFHEMIMDPEEPVESKQEWQEKSWDIEDTQLPSEIPSTSTTCSTLEHNSEEDQPQTMELRVFAGNIGQGPLFHTFSISLSTTADELVKTSVQRFGMINSVEPSQDTTIEYYLAVQGMDGDEYVLSAQDKPFSIFKTLTDSLTTPMPSFSHIKRISQQSLTSLQSRNSTSRRPRSSSFSNYEQTNYDEDSVIRFYLHRRIKRAHEREGLLYIKVSLYPDETSIITSTIISPQSAFTKNPTIPKSKSKNSKKRQQQQQQHIRSEIDRIDKIISVRQESLIGAVINLALEKFHVPDAVADDYQPGNDQQLRDSRQLGKYRMSVRGNGQETELNPNELMSNVLLQQKSSSPNHTGPITSDLLFVLRKAGSIIKKQSQKERHLNTTKASQIEQLPQLSIVQKDENTRRPSILDILMDSAPKMGERRPSVMSSLLEPPPRLTEDNRRPSGLNNINQERKPHQQYTQQASPSSSSSSSFPTSTKSPNSILGFNRRSSAQSSSVISSSSIDEQQLVNSDSTLIMDNIEVTPTSSSSIMRPSNSNSTDSRKKESFKQQFKRFVGWGSSSSSSSTSTKKQLNIPPPLTTPFSNQSDIQSPSDISFVSAPSTPLPPTPGTPRSLLPSNIKSRQGSSSHPLEVSTPIMSRRPSETNTLNDPSAAAIAAAAAVTASNKRLSTVSSISSSTASSVTSEEIAAATNQGLMMTDTNDDDSSDDDDDNDKQEPAVIVEEKKSIEQTEQQPMQTEVVTTPNNIAEESNDIQTQYAMWMNSQTNVTIPEEEINVAPIPPVKSPSSITTAANTAILTKALPPVTPQQPVKNPLRNKSSNISNATTATTNTPPSVVATTPAQSNCATTATPSIASANTKTEIEEPMVDSVVIQQQQQQRQQQQQQEQQQEPLHPMPSNNGQDLDDLFLLVAHGVDFLTSRENTKWEEEGGYEFHPWNRPQSSFAVRQQEQQQRNKEIPPFPIEYDGQQNQTNDGESMTDSSPNNSNNGDVADNTSAALAMARSLLLSPTASEEQQQNKPISPPLTPLPQQPLQENQPEEHVQQQTQQQESPLSMAKRILGAKVEVQSPIPQTQAQQQPQQQHQSVDDEELQRIVASHIVF